MCYTYLSDWNYRIICLMLFMHISLPSNRNAMHLSGNWMSLTNRRIIAFTTVTSLNHWLTNNVSNASIRVLVKRKIVWVAKWGKEIKKLATKNSVLIRFFLLFACIDRESKKHITISKKSSIHFCRNNLPIQQYGGRQNLTCVYFCK